MPTYSYYDLTTGALTGRSFKGPQSMVEANAPVGCGWVEGEFDGRARRVVDGEVVEWQPPQPPDTDNWTHEWSAAAGRWLRAPSQALALRRARRVIEAQIAAEELGQVRPLRELLLAQGKASPEALARLRVGDDTVRALREQLQALPAMDRAALAQIGRKP